MIKVAKRVTLTREIYDHINSRKGFNFSNWVRDTYMENCMSAQKKIEQITEMQLKIERLKSEIADESVKLYDEESNMSRDERRFLVSVPKKIAEGRDKSAILRFYNETYGRRTTHEEFNELIARFSSASQKKQI